MPVRVANNSTEDIYKINSSKKSCFFKILQQPFSTTFRMRLKGIRSQLTMNAYQLSFNSINNSGCQTNCAFCSSSLSTPHRSQDTPLHTHLIHHCVPHSTFTVHNYIPVYMYNLYCVINQHYNNSESKLELIHFPLLHIIN